LTYTLRGLRMQKAFALVVIACLGTGIGVNATIFSVVDGVLIQPFQYDEPDRIVVPRMTKPASNIWYGSFSYPDFRDYTEAQKSFVTVSAVHFRSFTLSDSGEPERYRGAALTWNMFSMLGVRPALGRDFTDADDRPGAPDVILISHDVWR